MSSVLINNYSLTIIINSNMYKILRQYLLTCSFNNRLIIKIYSGAYSFIYNYEKNRKNEDFYNKIVKMVFFD